MRFCRSPGIGIKILPSAPIRNSGTSKMATAPLSSSSLAAGLLQDLSANSSLSSTFSSPSFETALQSASPADLVTLSAQALQLQQADLLFTDSNPVSSSTSASDSLTAILSAIESSDTASTASAAPSSTASLATFRRKIRLSVRTDHQWAVARTRKRPAVILPGSEVVDPGAVRKISFYGKPALFQCGGDCQRLRLIRQSASSLRFPCSGCDLYRGGA